MVFNPQEVVEGGEEEESKPEGESEGGEAALSHQFTRTSVESQPGSLEDADANESRPNPVTSIEVPKMAASGGGGGQRRSRSPARVKRRKPKESDVELDDI